MAVSMYLGIWAIIGSTIVRNDACSFKETEHLYQLNEKWKVWQISSLFHGLTHPRPCRTDFTMASCINHCIIVALQRFHVAINNWETSANSKAQSVLMVE